MPKITLIEDDPTMQSLLKTLLEMDGYAVEVLDQDQSSHFVDQIQKQSPDLIILDYHLKYVDGLDLLVEIRQSGELSKIPIIMTSGSDVREVCLERGADGFLLKPYMPDDLINLIKYTIKNN